MAFASSRESTEDAQLEVHLVVIVQLDTRLPLAPEGQSSPINGNENSSSHAIIQMNAMKGAFAGGMFGAWRIPDKEALESMLHAGLDLSRKRRDVEFLEEDGITGQMFYRQ